MHDHDYNICGFLQTNGVSSNSKSSTVAMKQQVSTSGVEPQAFQPEPDPQLESESAASARNVESESDTQQIPKLYPNVSDSNSVQSLPSNELKSSPSGELHDIIDQP